MEERHLDIKVCGITRAADLRELEALGVTYAGMIFYAPSPRYVAGRLSGAEARSVTGLRKVGVFVDAPLQEVLRLAGEYGLDMVQLHGHESPAYCRELRHHITVMKAFRLRQPGDLEATGAYEEVSDVFLFDAQGPLYGGNGVAFDWSLLDHYGGGRPFFLSGGIGPGDVPSLKAFSHPRWQAVDVNSRFETAPGEKNIDDLKQFLWDLNFSSIR